MEKKSAYDFLTDDEKELIKVLETAIRNARSIQEIEEAKQCIGKLMMKIPIRMKKEGRK